MTTAGCTHLDAVTGAAPSDDGCTDCLAIGGQWAHLRRCAGCGHVGCCDSSPHRHASAHFRYTAHPLIQSFEPGEDWYWCSWGGKCLDAGNSPANPHLATGPGPLPGPVRGPRVSGVESADTPRVDELAFELESEQGSASPSHS